MLQKALDGIEILTGIQIAEAQLPDCCHRPLLHAVEQVHKVPVKVVVDLKAVYGGLPQQNASGATKHINKSTVLQREKCVQNMQDRSFVSDAGYRRFYADHLFPQSRLPSERKLDQIIWRETAIFRILHQHKKSSFPNGILSSVQDAYNSCRYQSSGNPTGNKVFALTHCKHLLSYSHAFL